MSRTQRARRALVLGSVVSISACQVDSPTAGSGAAPETPELRQAAILSPDPLLAHARAIPGFGGFFLDGDGRPTVYLKDAGQRRAAMTQLADIMSRLGKEPTRLQVKQGTYDYLELHQWYTRAAPEALALPSVVFADLDEGSNRLRVGVETVAAENSVRGVLARHAIPGAALLVERAEPVRLAATLHDVVTPRRGALRIESPIGGCSLGFNNLRLSELVVRSFVTASHCTTVHGGLDGTQFHQPAASNLIGTEVVDPPFFTGLPCPPGKKCRFSDAARVQYASGIGADLGGIARTTVRSIANAPITIDPAKPFFNITAELIPVQGVEVNKVGPSTGWTYSKIAGTCVGINVPNDITFLCQSRTSLGIVPGLARDGDSGSPVFYWGGGDNVTLVGILWGGNTSNTRFNFSPMAEIEAELGPLKTF